MEIVKVRILNEAGEPAGREYSYFTAEPLGLGEIVQVPVSKGNQFPDEHLVKAAVVQVNVPESEIAAFRDRVKTIPSKRPDTTNAQAVLFKPEPEPSSAGPRECDVEHLGDYPDCFRDCPKDECDGIPATPEPFNPDDIKGRFVLDEKASAEAGTLVGDIEPNPNFQPELPAPLVLLDKEVDPLTSAMNPELVTACQEAKRLLEIAQGRTITSNEDLKPATDDLAIIRKGIRLVQEIRKRILAPFRAKVDIINAAFGDIIRPLEEADRLTAGKVTAFDQEQRRKTAEAKRIEDEKYRLAQEEATLKNGEITVPLDTVQAPPPVPEHVRTELGTLGGRSNWKARVVDFKLLPDEYKLPNETLLNSFARSTKGTRPIPGVEFYDDRVVTVRTK